LKDFYAITFSIMEIILNKLIANITVSIINYKIIKSSIFLMRFIFFIFIFSQIFNFLSVFADKVKKESSNSEIIQWEKLQDNNSNNLKKIIWKSYQGDESYFKENREDNATVNQKNNSTEVHKFESLRRSAKAFTEIEPFLPLNNFLDYGKFQLLVRWKSSFDGGASGGTGQQNPSFIFDYGISDSSLLSIYVTGADDDLYNLIGDQKVNYYWQSYALSLKKRLIDENEFNFGLSIATTIEYWRQASGSEKSKSIYNQRDNSFGKDKFENIVGSISLPLSKNVNNNLNLFVVPGITFLPDKLGKNGIGKNAYGTNLYIGSGLVLGINQNINLLLSYTTPLGPGHNYFDSKLNFSRKSIYSFGLGWSINPKILIEGKITNSYGASPSTGLLTIPSDNLPLYSANIVYKPYEPDTLLAPLNKRDRIINFGGVTVNNALIPKAGSNQISINYDSEGNWFGSYGYSLSDIFQIELINIGSFKVSNPVANHNQNLYSTYLTDNNVNYRLAGKLLFLSPQKDDSFWLSMKTSFGRNDENNQGYLFSELMSTFRLNERVAFNLNPKYFFSGVKSFGALGVSNYINLFDNLLIIPEINTTFKHNSDFNSSLALRYSFKKGQSIDFYYSNAVGIQDIGQFFEDKKHRFGMKLNFLY